MRVVAFGYNITLQGERSGSAREAQWAGAAGRSEAPGLLRQVNRWIACTAYAALRASCAGLTVTTEKPWNGTAIFALR